jgi:guanylate kinase
MPCFQRKIQEEDNEMKRKGQIFVVSAPSGTGKTTICREVLKMVPDLKLSISYTTRPPRPIEKDGKDYFFVAASSFEEMVRQEAFAEWAQVHGYSYGTPKKTLLDSVENGQDVLLNIDSQGAMQLKKCFSQAVFVYLLPPSFDTLKTRLMDRALDPSDVINKRLEKAAEEIRNYSAYTYLIVNDDLKKAVDDLRAIIQAERLKVHLVDHAWANRVFRL